MLETRKISRSSQILEAAVVLFNEHGVSNVRSRDVSNVLGISNGNLTYHFPTMESLVEGVVLRILEEGQALNPVDRTTPISIAAYYAIIREFVPFHMRYTFFFKDILELTRRYPGVGRIHRTMLEDRIRHSRALIAAMVDSGIVEPEPAAGVYDRLHIRMLTNSIFWSTTEELVRGLRHGQFDPALLLLDILHPYLTQEGKRQYADLAMADAL
jgi:AcrR family transcriptional regulator